MKTVLIFLKKTNTANCLRQPHQLNANQRHVHLIKINYYEDSRSGQQLEAAQRQHVDHLHIIFLGVGGTCHKEHTINQLARLYASLKAGLPMFHQTYPHAIGNKITLDSQVLEPGASSDPPDPD
eukprot:scaffold57883_cov17-Tisochrysis_lutea.AAC.1